MRPLDLRIARAGGGYQATHVFDVPPEAGTTAAIDIGDVDGDAVADLLVIATDSTDVRRLYVSHELTSRQVAP